MWIWIFGHSLQRNSNKKQENSFHFSLFYNSSLYKTTENEVKYIFKRWKSRFLSLKKKKVNGKKKYILMVLGFKLKHQSAIMSESATKTWSHSVTSKVPNVTLHTQTFQSVGGPGTETCPQMPTTLRLTNHLHEHTGPLRPSVSLVTHCHCCSH